MKLRRLRPKTLLRKAREALRERHHLRALSEYEELEWRKCQPCDTAFYDAGAAQVGHLLYIFGGFRRLGTVSSDVRVFDLESEKWLPRFSAPPDLPQSHCAVTTDGQRYIYCASGQLGPQCSPAIPDVFAFDTLSRNWSKLPALPAARYAGTMQLWNGRLHFIGGAKSDRWTASSDHWSIGIANGDATETEWRRMPPIPLAGMHRGSILHQGSLYVFGGQKGDFVAAEGAPNFTCTAQTQEEYLAGCFRLDQPDGDWIRLPDLPTPVSHTDFSVVEHQGRILLIGGQVYKDPVDFQMRLTDAIQAYDVGAGKWEIVGHLPFRLKIPVVGSRSNRLYVFGGQRGISDSDLPGKVSKDVWAASLDGLPAPLPTRRSSALAGKSILLISHELSVSGAPLILVETAQRLIEAGAEVRLANLSNDTSGFSIAARRKVPVIPAGSSANHAAACDLIIANTVDSKVMRWVEGLVETDPTATRKLISWVHEIDIEHFMPDAQTIRHSAMRIFDSHACHDAWAKALGPLANSVVIHPYVDPALLTSIRCDTFRLPSTPRSGFSRLLDLPSRREARRKLGVRDEDFLVLNLATVEARKGQRILLETLTRLAVEEGIPIKLLLVGFRNWRHRAKFLLGRSLSQRGVLSSQRAYVRQREIAAFYRVADAFVLNTQGIDVPRGECFGRVTVEAMAAGVPTLGTDAGGTAEIIVDGTSGYLFPPGPEGQSVLASRLSDLARIPDLARTIGRAGQTRVTEKFGVDRFTREFEGALERVLRSQNGC